MPKLACVLLNYRFPEYTLACLESLRRTGSENFKVFLVNNYSDDGSGNILQARMRETRIEYTYIDSGENLGYAAGMNLGIQAALLDGNSHLILLNNDAEVTPDFFQEVQKAILDFPDSIIAGKVLDQSTLLPSYNIGRIHPLTCRVKDIFDPEFQGDIDFVSGCLMIVPAQVFRRIGLFEGRYFMYREDFNFCLRLKEHGVSIRYRPTICIHHRISSTSTRVGVPVQYYVVRNQTHAVLKHGSIIQKGFYGLYLCGLIFHRALFLPALFRQAFRGAWDAFRGRLGKRHQESRGPE